MGSPVFATKILTVKAWLDRECGSCGLSFDIEQRAARMSPSEPYVIAPGEKHHAVMDATGAYACPRCGVATVDHAARMLGESMSLGKSENKKVAWALYWPSRRTRLATPSRVPR